MAKKTLDIAGSAVGCELAEKVQASRGGHPSANLPDVIAAESIPEGVELEPVTEYAAEKLKDHPLNKGFFDELPISEYNALRDDIRRRGVLVPIIATAAGVILSGHRRVRITREIGRLYVPVQFVRGELTADQEREFLIKDNLLRRHLGPEEKKRLIVALAVGELDQDRRGKSSKKQKVQTELLATQAATPEPLPDRIERETGGQIKAGTAKRLIADIRKANKGESVQPTPPTPADTLKAVRSHLVKIPKLLDGSDRQTIAAAAIAILETLDWIDTRYSDQVKPIIENLRGEL